MKITVHLSDVIKLFIIVINEIMMLALINVFSFNHQSGYHFFDSLRCIVIVLYGD